MTTITVSEDCGNAPKKAVLRDLNVAFAENDAEFVLDSVTGDVEWTVVGDREIRGKRDFVEAIERMREEGVTELVVEHVITHGATGAVDGTLKLDDGSAYAFCDVYEFENTRNDANVRTMTSFVVEIEDEAE